MGFRVIIIISIVLLSIGKSVDVNYKYSKKPFKRNYSKLWSKEISRFYDATQIGYKRGLNKDLLEAFKRLGVIHLLTPSGIHLASILYMLKKVLSKRLIGILIILLLIILNFLSGFYSIKRICIFYILNQRVKSTKISFILTFLIDLLIGGYSNSPLSFALSFMFWGTILFSNNNKLLILCNLYISQLISAFFFQNQINLISLILNPILTSIFSMFFSVLSFNYWSNTFDLIDSFSMHFLAYFRSTILFLDEELIFAAAYINVLFLLIILIPKKYHLRFVCIYISLNSMNLNNCFLKVSRHSYYLKRNECKVSFSAYGFDNKCYLRDIKKAQKNLGQ